jgi:hypothetical protein
MSAFGSRADIRPPSDPSRTPPSTSESLAMFSALSFDRRLPALLDLRARACVREISAEFRAVLAISRPT